MWGPFGPRRVTYADYTASGRALDFIERFVADEVLPRYANTHTESSGTGLQTTRLREDARRIDRGHRQADPHSGPAHPGRPRRPVRPQRAHPARAAPGRVHRTVRAPLQRA